MTYRALEEPLASPVKKTKMEFASDNIIQEVPPSVSTLKVFLISYILKVVLNMFTEYVYSMSFILKRVSVCDSEDSLQRAADNHQPVHQVYHKHTAPPAGGRGNYTHQTQAGLHLHYL